MMQSHDEGYIKFQCFLRKSSCLMPLEIFQGMNGIRTQLWNKKWLGSYHDGVGYGNVSVRDPDQPGRFFITGSATGHIRETSMDSWVRVDRWNLAANSLWCTGSLNASSESLTHAVIYETLPDVSCVIHIHDVVLWKEGLISLPTTSKSATYGTPEMANSIKDLIMSLNMRDHGLMAMGGHQEGLLAIGSIPELTLNRLLQWADRTC